MTDNANFWQLLVIGSYMGWSLRAACAVDIEERQVNVGSNTRGIEKDLPRFPICSSVCVVRAGAWSTNRLKPSNHKHSSVVFRILIFGFRSLLCSSTMVTVESGPEI